MKMKKYHLFLMAAVLALLSSCSKVPEYAKVIPDDAVFVMRIDAKQLAEKSGIGDNDKAKKQFAKMLKDADLSRGLQEKMEKIIDDPASCGIALDKPMFVYMAEDGSDMKGGLVGAVRSKGDLTDLLNDLAKESDGDKVKEEKNYSYIEQRREVLVFTDDWFYFGERKYSDDAEDFADDICKLFEKDAKGSILETDEFNKMCDATGVAQILINGKGLASMRDTKELEQMMPEGVDLEKASFMLDLTLDKGEVALMGEVLTDDAGWKKYMADSDKLMGNISGDLLKYIKKDGLAIFANIDGAAVYDRLKDLGMMKMVGDDEQAMVKKVLGSIKGDVAVGFSDIDMQKGIPTAAFYMQTKDNSIVSVVAQTMDSPLKQKASDQYTAALPMAGDGASVNFGFKNNISYISVGQNPKEFDTPSGAFSKSDLKGKKAYAYFGFAILKKLEGMASGEEKLYVDALLKLCDYVEFYAESNSKAVLRLVTKDKNTTPLASLINYGIETLDNMQKGESMD